MIADIVLRTVLYTYWMASVAVGVADLLGLTPYSAGWGVYVSGIIVCGLFTYLMDQD